VEAIISGVEDNTNGNTNMETNADTNEDMETDAKIVAEDEDKTILVPPLSPI
jgi:hypothetical protein